MKTSNNYSEIRVNGIKFYRVENDVNGNPRYVMHFWDVFSEEEKERLNNHEYNLDISTKFKLALCKAYKIGGKTYRAKWFGGGIVFQSYNLEETAKFFKETRK